MINSYKDLEIFKESYKLSIEVYKITEKYPNYEKYELASQIRRAATSIPLNIAEGYGKKESSAEFKRFLRMSMGSANETQVLLSMGKDLGYISEKDYIELANEYEILGKRINTLISRWK